MEGEVVEIEEWSSISIEEVHLQVVEIREIEMGRIEKEIGMIGIIKIDQEIKISIGEGITMIETGIEIEIDILLLPDEMKREEMGKVNQDGMIRETEVQSLKEKEVQETRGIERETSIGIEVIEKEMTQVGRIGGIETIIEGGNVQIYPAFGSRFFKPIDQLQSFIC